MTLSEPRNDTAPAGGIGFFEKWLSVWVGGAIILGTGLGALAPDACSAALSVV